VRILVVNAGSQSVKLGVVGDGDQLLAARTLGPPDDSTPDELGDFLEQVGEVDVAGHRVVHGGHLFTSPVLVDSAQRASLAALSDLAPLHNPPALSAIDTFARLRPRTPSVACFDTAFHAHLPDEAATYALPSEWVARWGIRRFGFHGLSCAWAARRAERLLDRPIERLRLVVCHLGGGASVTAISFGRSVDTTMGFTPLEGLVMATRPGDVDPGAVLWALRHGLSATDAEHDLEHRSGLLGLSGGRSSDMKELLTVRTHGDTAADLAVRVYLHRLRAKIASMAASASGVDAITFTGGIGEHSPEIRAETAGGLAWMGVNIDDDANLAVAATDRDISAPTSPVRTLVVHAREDLQIAHECRQLMAAQDPPGL
jgi:acetate kinase